MSKHDAIRHIMGKLLYAGWKDDLNIRKYFLYGAEKLA